MNKKHPICLILSLFLIHTAHGMDNEMDKGTITFISNQKYNYPYLVKDILDNKQLNNFACEQLVCSQDGCIKSIESAQKRGSQVNLFVGPHCQNKQVLSTIKGIRRDNNIHGKVTVGVENSPSTHIPSLKRMPMIGTALIGSGNTSNQTWKHMPQQNPVYNFESGILINNHPLVNKTYSMIKSQSPMQPEENLTTIKETPEKPEFYGSFNTDFSKSIVTRLNNFSAIKDPEKKALIRTMTFSDPDIAEAIIKVGPHAELLVDSAALTKNGIPLLDKISSAGASVNVFCAKNGSRAKLHPKDITLISENKTMHMNFTANLSNNNRQRNYMVLVPNDKDVVTDATTDFKTVKEYCIPYEKAKQLKKEENSVKATKRKLDAAAKNPPAKKKRK